MLVALSKHQCSLKKSSTVSSGIFHLTVIENVFVEISEMINSGWIEILPKELIRFFSCATI